MTRGKKERIQSAIKRDHNESKMGLARMTDEEARETRRKQEERK